MYIPVTEDGRPFYSEGVAVRFYQEDGTDWVANFEAGWTDLKKVFNFADTDHVLVVACGRCYLMDIEQARPIAVFGVDYKHAVRSPDRRLILASTVCLTIVESDGTHWNTERISWDGLEDLQIDGSTVSGVAYHPMLESDEWVPFSYDIDRRELVGGSFDWYEPLKKRPWWKFWRT